MKLGDDPIPFALSSSKGRPSSASVGKKEQGFDKLSPNGSRWLLVLAILVLLLPTPAIAQADQCRIPDRIAAPRLLTPPPGERRMTPIDGHTLALSWSPQFCRTRARDPRHRLQCGGADNGGVGRFGFILHGLWPEGRGPDWPQWCRAAPSLPRALVRRHLCTTPSVDLIHREWAKHGSCMTRDPARYLSAGTRLFEAMRYPDMAALSRRRVTVRQFANAFAARNRGLSPDMLRVQTDRRGWLTEVRICLARDARPRRCPAHMRGAAGGSRLRIWRGEG